MRIAPLATGLIVLLATSSAMPASGKDPAHGLWLTENGKAVVEFTRCGPATCGHMVWVANPRDADGNPKLDARGQPFCGLQLVGGLEPVGTGVWEDGWIYNPKSGRTYSADIKVLSPTELRVRGYLGLRIFGSSQIWTRVEDDRGGCV